MRGRPASIRYTLLLTIGGLTLLIVVLVASGTWRAWQRLADMQALEDRSQVSDDLFTAAEMLGVERGVAFSMLHAPDRQTAERLRATLESSRRGADITLEATLASLKSGELTDLAAKIATAEAQLSEVRALRTKVDEAARVPLQHRDPSLSTLWFSQASDLILATHDIWLTYDKRFAHIDPQKTLHMRLKHALRLVADYGARERALVGRLIVQNAPPTYEEQAWLIEWHSKVDLAWQLSRTLVDLSGLGAPVASAREDAESHYLTLYDMVRDVFYRPGVQPETPYPISVEFWFELSTHATDALHALGDATLVETRRHVEDLAAHARRGIRARALVLLIALGLCAYTFVVITRRVLEPIDGMVAAMMTATGEVGEGRDEIGKLARVLNAFRRNTEEIKRTAEMLGYRTQALERSNKELDDFAYIASHDLKEPLRGIHNHSRFLLEDNRDKLDAESAKRLGRLLYLSQRMERLVNDLLYFSRLGRQELAIKPTDLNAVIRDVAGTLDVMLEERHARIVIPQPLPTITCDAVRVTELFRNLITNAVKYNDKERKLVEIGVEKIRKRPDGTLARNIFYVRDNGVGIAPEFHDEVFRIFKRLQSNTGEDTEGTGVGLTFVKKIVERHGGKIWLESEAGKGTVFYFTLGEESSYANARAAA